MVGPGADIGATLAPVSVRAGARAGRGAAAALLVVLGAAGCGSGTDAADRDCGALLTYAGATYRPVQAVQLPVRGEQVGRAGYAGCGGSPAPGLGRVAAYRVGGAEPTQALLAPSETGDQLYVATDTPRTQWPATVRAATRPLRCTAPMTFDGTWDLLVNDGHPGSGRFDVPAPYPATFTARSSEAIDPTVWASVTVRATVTDRTSPLPSPATAEAAIDGHRPVTVSTTCHDGAFEVAHLELAD